MSSSSSSNLHKHQEYGMVVSASAMGAVMVVGGFCWLFYCICHSSTRIARSQQQGHVWNTRKPSIVSVSSATIVPGDGHGHYYNGRNPRVYIDGRNSSGVSMGSPNRLLSPLSAYHTSFLHHSAAPPQNSSLQMAHSVFQMEDPPPYPGEMENGNSPPSPLKAPLPLPPPYSA